MSKTTTNLMNADDLRHHFLSVYLECTEAEKAEGRAWYPSARRMIREHASVAGITPLAAAGIFSAYSTNNGWKGNVTMARNACAGTPRGMRPVLAKVGRIFDGEDAREVLTSPKLRNFMRNLTGDYRAVTVDRWMARLAGDYSGNQPTGDAYRQIATAIREAAQDIGERPAHMQAILWVAIRGTGA